MPLSLLIEMRIVELDHQIAEMLDMVRTGNASRQHLNELRRLTALRSDGYDMLDALARQR